MSRLYKRRGVYYADYYAITPSGKRERRRETLATASKAVAVAKLKRLELAAADPATHEVTPRLDDAVSHFVDVACATKAEGTRQSYRVKSRHLVRLLGRDTRLGEITRVALDEYVAQRLGEKAMAHTIHKELMAMRGTLKAHELSPAIVPPIKNDYVPRETWLTRDQYDALHDAMATTHANDPVLAWRRQTWVALHVFASCNFSEAAKMRWDDVHEKHIRIRGTKRDSRDRMVPLDEDLRALLDVAPTTGPLVVGRWVNATRDLERFCAAALPAVPRVTSNDLRRTFASWQAQAGVELITVAQMMGHSSTRMVERVYAQIDMTTKTAAIAKMPRRGLRRVK